jgi:hypothetical protein
MSAAALKYVKKLITAPNGEIVKPIEKNLLWYIADGHNDESNAAWHSVGAIARDNNLSTRRVNEILAECIRKQVIWRQERLRETGSNQSNFWRFTEIDGPAPPEILIYEEKLRIRGEFAAARANGTKRARRFPQNGCEPGCESSQGADARSRRGGCESSQGEDANSRTLGCESSQGEDANSRRGRMRDLASLEPLIEPPGEPLLNPTLSQTEPLAEAQGAAAVESFWRRLVTELKAASAISESEYLWLYTHARQLEHGHINGAIGVLTKIPKLNEFWGAHAQQVRKAILRMGYRLRNAGLDLKSERVCFELVRLDA